MDYGAAIMIPIGKSILSRNQELDQMENTGEASPVFPDRRSGEEVGLRVEIISVEEIKPSVPTPHDLRTYELSGLDQFSSNLYMPFVYFYTNNDNGSSHTIDDEMITVRRKILKHSLSETLTCFYPLAGEIQGVRFIDCNDQGVYYVEAKANECMTSFLNQPNYKAMHKLLPFEPNSVELLSNTHVVMVQITIFSCGGISIGLCTSHKIVDGYSHTTFLNAWAATAHGSSQNIIPRFVSPSIFLPDPTNSSELLNEMSSPQHSPKTKYVAGRFVFSASSLATLKQNAQAPSRVFAVIALIWKCSIAAYVARSSLEGCAPKSSSTLRLSVNLRERSSPPFPPFSIGNIFMDTFTHSNINNCSAEELHFLARRLKSTVDKVNSGYIEKMKGKEAAKIYREDLNKMKKLIKEKDPHRMSVTNMCNGNLYEADFGWGKPIWVDFGYTGAETSPFDNFACLMDTRSGSSIEAWVMLTEDEMSIFKRDEELLSYASFNPSPLQTIY